VINQSRELKTQALAERRSRLDVHIVSVERGHDDFALVRPERRLLELAPQRELQVRVVRRRSHEMRHIFPGSDAE